MLCLASVLLLAFQAPAVEGTMDGWRSFQGAGAKLQVPPGMVVDESTNGRIYFLDVRRPLVGHDLLLPFLRVVIVPNEAVTPDQVSHLMSDAATVILGHEGYALRETREVLASVAGADRTGTRLLFTQDNDIGWDLDAFALQIGTQVAGVAAKTYASQSESERALHARILQSLSFREIDGSEPILARVGSVGVRLPAMLVFEVDWSGDPQVGKATLRLPEGMLILSAQDCRSEIDARRAEEVAFAEFVHSVQREAEVSSGAVVLEGSAAGLMVAGAEVLPFQRIAVKAQGKRHELLSTVVRDGAWIFALQLVALEENITAAEVRFESLLSALDFSFARPPERVYSGQGLRFSLPALMRASFFPAPHFAMQAVVDHASENDLPNLFIEWRTDATADQHENMHLSFRNDLFPGVGATWAGEWTVPCSLGEVDFLVSVLGEQGEQGLLATAARPWRDGTLAIVFTMPHARNAKQAEGFLHHVLAGAREFDSEERVRLRSGRAYLDLKDGAWLGWESDRAQQPEIVVAAPWGELHLSLSDHGEAEPWLDHELSAQARDALSYARAQHEKEWKETDARIDDWVEIPGLGRAARMRQGLDGAGKEAFLEVYAVNVPRGLMRIWVFATGAPNGAARDEIAALLAAVGCDPILE
ncbi:MAG: hypothetical protein O3A20_01330 [Planctomycetota bacterium]|nr:hypothetical protein [Planctomycetota bacterium]